MKPKLILNASCVAHYKDLAEILKVLSNPNRLMILALLRESPSSVNELQASLSVASSLSQSSLSQHLALLRAHRLVRFEKCGQLSRYSIDPSYYLPLIEELCANPACYLQDQANGS